MHHHKRQTLAHALNAYLDYFQGLVNTLPAPAVTQSHKLETQTAAYDFKEGKVHAIQAKDWTELTTHLIRIALRLDAYPQAATLLVLADTDLRECIVEFISNIGSIDVSKLKVGMLEDAEWPRFTESIEFLRHRNIQVISGCQSWSTLLAEVELHLKKVGSRGAVVIDRRCTARPMQRNLKFQSATSVGVAKLEEMALQTNAIIVQVSI